MKIVPSLERHRAACLGERAEGHLGRGGLDTSGVAALAPHAQAIFRDSDNIASGSAIDHAGGMNAVNVFYAGKAGMVDSALTQWFGSRAATNSPRKMGDDNYFTAKDVVTFLSRLAKGTLLGAAETTQLETCASCVIFHLRVTCASLARHLRLTCREGWWRARRAWACTSS